MTIHLHIDRLVLDGLDLAGGEHAAIGAAVERELTRLIATGGLAAWTHAGTALPSVAAPAIDAVRGPGPLGTQIAGAVYGGIGPSSGAPGTAPGAAAKRSLG